MYFCVIHDVQQMRVCLNLYRSILILKIKLMEYENPYHEQFNCSNLTTAPSIFLKFLQALGSIMLHPIYRKLLYPYFHPKLSLSEIYPIFYPQENFLQNFPSSMLVFSHKPIRRLSPLIISLTKIKLTQQCNTLYKDTSDVLLSTLGQE